MFHSRCIHVIGSGFVGEATGKGFLGQGHRVTFVDVRPERIAQLREEGLQAGTPDDLRASGTEADLTVFTINTPTVDGKINLKPLRGAMTDFAKRLANSARYQVAVVRSTVVPGTTEELITLIEETSGKKVGVDFGMCMNPEYLREKTAVKDFANPWIVVIGQYDERSGDILSEIYENFTCPKYRLTLKEAEMQKYVHNIYNAVKITYFNEMRQIARQAGIEPEHMFALVAKSAEAMWRPEYGIKDFGPFDGSCLPKDTQAFLHWAQTNDWDMPLLATTIDVNNALLAAACAKVSEATRVEVHASAPAASVAVSAAS